MPSPFLTPGSTAQADGLALLHLRRDQSIPTILRTYDDENQGYDEGKVETTRFGSFPHSTLINKPWGSQIIASVVDTGSRGRKSGAAKKRKADEFDASGTTTGADDETSSLKKPVAAASGFIHLMAPTPEAWTLSLPHRTQVVYTPDYSYILHRLRARPGNTVIEAGAGSGSFTHASVRAVFNGYPDSTAPAAKRRRLGKVCSYEFHEPRAGRVKDEISQHGLDGLVEVTHRDVYEDGFLLDDPKTGRSPNANAIFLDLPAPWLALKHLVRKPPSGAVSPLDPSSPAYLCTFSPCLEQVERTISTMRQLGWLSITMVEVNHHMIDVKRERIGLDAQGVRGALVVPRSVDEAVAKMRGDEERTRRFREAEAEGRTGEGETKTSAEEQPAQTPSDIPSYNLGRLVHRTEDNLKTHTSYLVFAILPREWSEEDEQRCREKWPSAQTGADATAAPKSKRQMKQEARAKRQQEEQEAQGQSQHGTDAKDGDRATL